MRKDQLERLSLLSEKLADVVLDEADPDFWPGFGVPIADMTKEERGDRYWCKKNAAATLMLLTKVETIRAENPKKDPDDEPNLDKVIAKAEADAAKLVESTLQQVGKKAFLERTTGKKH